MRARIEGESSAWTYLGLGSNLGGRRSWLSWALERIRAWPETSQIRSSPVYETEHVGPGSGPQYLNLCLRARVNLEAPRILQQCQQLEREAGRVRLGVGRPRSLDVDLLLHRGQVLLQSNLVVPHPRLAERRFVLAPLADLDPDLLVGDPVRRAADRLADPDIQSQVARCLGPAEQVLRQETGSSG